MTTCRAGCGACCDPVVLSYTPSEVLRDPGIPAETKRWVLEDLTPMPRSEAKAKFPAIVGRALMGMRGGKPVGGLHMFYRCRNLDPETRECRIHDRRPEPCRDYPWGDGPPDARTCLPAECEFNADVGRPVVLTTKEAARGPSAQA